MPVSGNTRIVLASRPVGDPTRDDFRIEHTALPEPADGQVLLETLYLSIDPYMRSAMRDSPSYMPPFQIGAPLIGATVSRVVASRHKDWAEGDIVLGWAGWQRYASSDVDVLRKVDPAIAPVSTALGVLGMPGFTAYAGLKEIGKPKRGDTVVVAAASGAVGSAVGQIAKMHGARAVGIAGGREKCAFVRDTLGFDAVVDHRAADFEAKLAEACPEGIDVYFELVGGAVWAAVRPLLNAFARIPVCGLIAHYNEAHEGDWEVAGAPSMRHILIRSMTVRGFVQTEFKDALEGEFLEQASAWFAAGKLRHREHVVDGLENAPQALVDLMSSRNFGKTVVKVSD